MKYYIHPEAVVTNGKAVCLYCKRQLPLNENGLPKLETDFPCTVSVPTPFDSEVEISVWDCSAHLFFRDRKVDLNKLPEKLRERLKKLMHKSIFENGGALNWSGIYPPDEELCRFIRAHEKEILACLE